MLAVLLSGLEVAPVSGAGYAGSRREVAPAVKVTTVAGGLYQSLAVTSTGVAFAWGWNITGQLCDGSTTGSDVPVKVALPASARVTGIAGGFADSAVMTSAGQAFACGKDDDGDLGDGSTSTSDVPVKVALPAGTKVTGITLGADDGLALTSTGAVLAWGYDGTGQLGNDSTGSSDVPVDVDLPKGIRVTAVAAASNHNLALTSTGTVLAWGYNIDGELGDGNKVNSDAPVKVKLPPGTRVTGIAAGGFDSLALTSTGTVLAWGYNADGELGDGNRVSSDVPVKVKLPAGTKVTRIAAGQVQSLAVTSTGAVLAWGGNNFGQLGDGSYEGSDMPVKVVLP